MRQFWAPHIFFKPQKNHQIAMAFVTQLLDGGHHIGAEFHQIPGPVSLRCVKWGGTKQREHMFVIYIIYINSAVGFFPFPSRKLQLKIIKHGGFTLPSYGSKVQHGTFWTPVMTWHLAQHELGFSQGADGQEDQHLWPPLAIRWGRGEVVFIQTNWW